MRLNLEDTAAPLPSASFPSSVATTATVPAPNANAALATTPRPQGHTLKPTKRPQRWGFMVRIKIAISKNLEVSDESPYRDHMVLTWLPEVKWQFLRSAANPVLIFSSFNPHSFLSNQY